MLKKGDTGENVFGTSTKNWARSDKPEIELKKWNGSLGP